MVKGGGMGDREATQIFEIRSILMKHFGKQLDHNVFEEFSQEMEEVMRRGPCSWAFKKEEGGVHGKEAGNN